MTSSKTLTWAIIAILIYLSGWMVLGLDKAHGCVPICGDNAIKTSYAYIFLTSGVYNWNGGTIAGDVFLVCDSSTTVIKDIVFYNPTRWKRIWSRIKSLVGSYFWLTFSIVFTVLFLWLVLRGNGNEQF